MTDKHEIQLGVSQFGDNSVIVDFNLYNHEEHLVDQHNGYVSIRQDEEDQCFYVAVFNADGDVVSETQLPYGWKPF